MKILLDNAGVDSDYDELDGYGPYVRRADMAKIFVDAFADKFKEFGYLYGNNMAIYNMLLNELDGLDEDEQQAYLEDFIDNLYNLDHREA